MEEWLGELVTFFVQLLLVALVVMGAIALGSRGQRSEGREQLQIVDLGQRQRRLRARLVQAMSPKRRRGLWPFKRSSDETKEAGQGDDSRSTAWVLDFHGNLKASGVDRLAREVSLLIDTAREGDDVIVRIESPGGVVHAYGQAAAELDRLNAAGLNTTVCVDKVAASGGYLMACNAKRIIVAPFAVIGSIGVVAQVPNVHRLLKRHDIDVELFTAGRYKRTVTVLGENTDEGRDKLQQDLENIHERFKSYVAERRTHVDIEAVSTGEVWYGEEAVAKGLADEVATSEAYRAQVMSERRVFSVKLSSVPTLAQRLGFSSSAVVDKALDRVEERLDASRWEHR